MMFKKFIQLCADCKAEADLKAIQKQAAKDEKKKRVAEEKKRQEAINCPYCDTHYSGIDYYREKTKKEDIKTSDAHMNFIVCKNVSCHKIFGVRERFISTDFFRHAFKLIDKY